jgi:hypothetical protein
VAGHRDGHRTRVGHSSRSLEHAPSGRSNTRGPAAPERPAVFPDTITHIDCYLLAFGGSRRVECSLKVKDFADPSRPEDCDVDWAPEFDLATHATYGTCRGDANEPKRLPSCRTAPPRSTGRWCAHPSRLGSHAATGTPRMDSSSVGSTLTRSELATGGNVRVFGRVLPAHCLGLGDQAGVEIAAI